MSEALWGVLIGGGISFVANWFQSRQASKATDKQINARMSEQSEQFKHEHKMAQVSRKIALQSAYLKPLQAKIGEVYEQYLDIENELTKIIKQYGTELDPLRNALILDHLILARTIKEFESRKTKLHEVKREIELIMSQCSDEMVTLLLASSLFPPIMGIDEFLDNLNKFTPQRPTEGLVTERTIINVGQMLEGIQNARLKINKINKQIESILSGET